MDVQHSEMTHADTMAKLPTTGPGLTCEEMPGVTTIARRFMRTKLGTIFTLLLCVALGLFVVNYAGSIFHRSSNTVSLGSLGGDFGNAGAGRGLAGFEHHRGPPRRSGHRRQGSGSRMQVCRIPKLSLDSDANKEAYHEMPPLECPGEQLFYVHMGNLRLNQTVLGNRKLSKCEFRSIEWVNDNFHTYSKTYVRKHEPFDIKVSHDFFRIECYLDTKHKTKKQDDGPEANDYHARRLLQAKENVEHIPDEGAIVSKNSPNLVGSFGVPDIANNVLGNHVKQAVSQKAVPQQQDDKQDVKLKSPLGETANQAIQEKLRALEKNQKRKAAAEEQSEEIQVPQQQVQHVKPEVPVQESKSQLHKAKSAEAQGGNAGENTNDEEAKDEKEDEDDAENQKNLENYEGGDPFDYNFEGLANPPDFDQFIAQIHVKDEVQERLNGLKPGKQALGMNVLMFALDSMSHMSYQRKLPKTYNYLQEVLNTVVMGGYNIVGDATTAALIPLLTGKTETELPEARINKDASQYVDIYPFIWNKYEQNGYVTLYAEDRPDLGTFQLRHNGFEQPPVDHYMRPFWQATEDADLHRNSPRFCLGSVPEHRYVLDYLRQFFMRYRAFPKFALSLIVELSHADNNPAEYIDQDLVDFLEFLRHNKALDNTLLVVMGDHGARYSTVRKTVQGKLEERLPFMSLTLPQWFKDKHPELYSNLKRNRMKLTTPFDVHETLRDILDIKRTEVPVHYADRGISLFKAIPRNRTCTSAGIDLHWCSCLQSEPVEITEPAVQMAAKELLNHINELTTPVRDKCEELRLQDILDARIVIPNEQVLKFQKSIDKDQRIANFSRMYKLDMVHHQITVETAPNGGQFEATVQLNLLENKHYITGTVSRINRYGNQPACITKTHPDLHKFCYCRQQQPPSKDVKAT